MNAGLIETSFERAATASFAAAVGYSAFAGLAPLVSFPELAICAAAAAIVAHLGCSHALGAVARRTPKLTVPVFDVRDIDLAGGAGELVLTEVDRLSDELVLTAADRLSDELVLTDADRLKPCGQEGDPLLLDDVLAEIGADSRVVRLFDRKAMPTPGQLKSRIDDHLTDHRQLEPDASQALSDALAELRRSLR